MSTLLYSDSDTMTSGSGAFVARLLHAAVAVHMLHLSAKGPGSFARHMALGDLYEGLPGLVDELAESYQGCTGQLLTFPSESFTVPTDALSYVSGLYEWCETGRGAMGTESHIQNIVDEICSLIAKALYKLKNLE